MLFFWLYVGRFLYDENHNIYGASHIRKQGVVVAANAFYEAKTNYNLFLLHFPEVFVVF